MGKLAVDRGSNELAANLAELDIEEMSECRAGEGGNESAGRPTLAAASLKAMISVGQTKVKSRG